MRHALLVLCLASVFCFACEGTPSDPAGWAKAATKRRGPLDKVAAIQEARKAAGDKKAAVPYLIQMLGKDTPAKVRAEAAIALSEIRDPAATKPLVEAIDYSDSSRRPGDTREANREIARTLGAIRAREPEVIEALTKLTQTGDGFTQVAAVDALGEIGDPAAVPALIKIAEDEGIDPFITKTALLALGKIGDERAVPVLKKMLFQERRGVSFFQEAAFATYQIGRPMAGPLLTVLKGQDTELNAWAKTNGVLEGALYAKAAQLLGDLGDTAAIPVLVEKLSYQGSPIEVQYLVRVYAAESLGRMRAKEAVKPLGELIVKETEADARDRYCDALSRIGDLAAVPYLTKAAQVDTWDMREQPLVAISRLGGESERAVIEKAKSKECQGAEKCDENEAARRKASYDRMLARLDAEAACKKDVACWVGKLTDKDAAVRVRAARELGSLGGVEQAEALAAAVVYPVEDEEDIAARYQALLSIDWIAAAKPIPNAAAIAKKLEGLVAQEKTRNYTAAVNEEVRRLAIRLRRTAEKM
jgi:HEAT repeat protein